MKIRASHKSPLVTRRQFSIVVHFSCRKNIKTHIINHTICSSKNRFSGYKLLVISSLRLFHSFSFLVLYLYVGYQLHVVESRFGVIILFILWLLFRLPVALFPILWTYIRYGISKRVSEQVDLRSLRGRKLKYNIFRIFSRRIRHHFHGCSHRLHDQSTKLNQANH